MADLRRGHDNNTGRNTRYHALRPRATTFAGVWPNPRGGGQGGWSTSHIGCARSPDCGDLGGLRAPLLSLPVALRAVSPLTPPPACSAPQAPRAAPPPRSPPAGASPRPCAPRPPPLAPLPPANTVVLRPIAQTESGGWPRFHGDEGPAQMGGAPGPDSRTRETTIQFRRVPRSKALRSYDV